MLTVIGASWCPDCKRAKAFLGQHRISYNWIDLEENPEAAKQVEELNGGKRIIPTLLFDDGTVLVEPSNDELADKLNIVRAAINNSYDLVIVGGGPASLTTAIYGARENLKVLIIEKSAVGGQAGITERFDNYPGFPEGIGGAELAARFEEQARKYGVEILQAVGVEEIREVGGERYQGIDIRTSTNQIIRSRAVVIATGSTYRRTEAKGEEDLIGAGIHFCATCDGPFYKGAEEVVVLGGGNSGLEEGIFLTQFAKHVTIFERGSELRASKILQEKVRNHPRMEIRTDEALEEFIADASGKLAALKFKNTKTGEVSEIKSSGAFLFIGLDPNTGWLNGLIKLDERKFIATNEMFATSIAGVFAAGDVRSGSTKQLAAAVGEGAAVAIQIRYFLDKVEAQNAK